jgi:hypothetical protein
MNHDLKKRFERFFDNKWAIDKNFAYHNPELADVSKKILLHIEE